MLTLELMACRRTRSSVRSRRSGLSSHMPLRRSTWGQGAHVNHPCHTQDRGMENSMHSHPISQLAYSSPPPSHLVDMVACSSCGQICCP